MLVAQSCLTLCDLMDCNPPDSSILWISQTRILEWLAIPFYRRLFQPRDQTRVSHIAGRFFTNWATTEALLVYQFSSVAQLCPILCNPMDCSIPGFPVHHELPKLTQTHVYWVGDAIQPSHPLLSPSPSVFNDSQNQGLFKWVSFLPQVAKVLEFQLQHQSFPMNTQDWSPLEWTG